MLSNAADGGGKMRRHVLTVAFAMLTIAAAARDCTQDDLASFSDIQAVVSRLLSFDMYTSSDEKILDKSGDLAAFAIMRRLTIQEMTSPEKARQILLILHMAFEAPQLITDSCRRTTTAAMLLLDELERTEYGRQPNVIANARFEIQHNTRSGEPLEPATLPGGAVIDTEHSQWVSSVLAWIADIKPGMTRKDLLGVLTTEGGLSTRAHGTYVLKQCPYIKVDVEFLAVPNEQDRLTEKPDDKIVKISRPYLEYAHAD